MECNFDPTAPTKLPRNPRLKRLTLVQAEHSFQLNGLSGIAQFSLAPPKSWSSEGRSLTRTEQGTVEQSTTLQSPLHQRFNAGTDVCVRITDPTYFRVKIQFSA